MSAWSKDTLVPVGNPARWWWQTEHKKLTHPLVFVINGEEITVPEGFITDGFSIPFGCRWLVRRWGAGTRWAILHDYLYQTAGLHKYSREQVDKMLRNGLDLDGVGKIRKGSIYTAVCAGGWKAWNRYIKNNTQESQKETEENV